MQKGDPGANVLAVGLFSALGALNIPLGTDLIQTSGRTARGVGKAQYIYSSDQASGASPTRAQSANGRWFDLAEPIHRPEHYGAAADVVKFSGASIATKSASLTVPGVTFQPADQGKSVTIGGAGASGAPLVTTIQTVPTGGSSTITLAGQAATTVASAYGHYGTDDTYLLNLMHASGLPCRYSGTHLIGVSGTLLNPASNSSDINFDLGAGFVVSGASTNAQPVVHAGTGTWKGGVIDCGGVLYTLNTTATPLITSTVLQPGYNQGWPAFTHAGAGVTQNIKVIGSGHASIRITGGGQVLFPEATGNTAYQPAIDIRTTLTVKVFCPYLHDHLGAGVYVNGQQTGELNLQSVGLKSIEGGEVCRIYSQPGDTGQTGNALHVFDGRNVEFRGVYVHDVGFSCFRNNGGVQVKVLGGTMENPGDFNCLYEEFPHYDNVFDGVVCINGDVTSANQTSSGGRQTVISNLTLMNGMMYCEGDAAISNIVFRFTDAMCRVPNSYNQLSGAGVQAAPYSLPQVALQLGAGGRCKNISVDGVVVIDECVAQPKRIGAVALLAGSGASYAGVSIRGVVSPGMAPVIGHGGGNPVTSMPAAASPLNTGTGVIGSVSKGAGTQTLLTGYISGTTLTVTGLGSNTLAAGQALATPGAMVNGPQVAPGTTISALGSGTGGIGTYTVSTSQTLGSSAGPVSLVAVSPAIRAGRYVVTMTSATAFKVVGPTGLTVGFGVLGTAFSTPEISLTITGSPAQGDTFNVDAGIEPAPGYAIVHSDGGGYDGSEYERHNVSNGGTSYYLVGTIPALNINSAGINNQGFCGGLQVEVLGDQWGGGVKDSGKAEYIVSVLGTDKKVTYTQTHAAAHQQALKILSDGINYYVVMVISGYFKTRITARQFGTYFYANGSLASGRKFLPYDLGAMPSNWQDVTYQWIMQQTWMTDGQGNGGPGSLTTPSGSGTGTTTAQGGAWNTPHLLLGPYHLWIASSGALRVKNGAPSSDTDGTIVGLQTA